jgi:hypothetical protein
MLSGQRSPQLARSRAFTGSPAPRRMRGGASKRNTDPQGSLYIARNTFEMLSHHFEPLARDEEWIEIVG